MIGAVIAAVYLHALFVGKRRTCLHGNDEGYEETGVLHGAVEGWSEL